ncbi:MAG: hypothetical protein WEB06_07405 [Actinomycetota bacterium]
MARSKGIGRAVALIVLTMALVAMVAAPASAGPRVRCVMNGNVVITEGPGGGWDWTVGGTGPCLDFLNGPFDGIITGSGHSATLGLCDGLVVTDLKIKVSLTLANLRNGVTTVTSETWRAPISTFPIATPFFVRGGENGVGTILTRLLLNCPPGGASVATFVFETST